MEPPSPQRLLQTPTWLLTHVATRASRLSREAFATVAAGRYEYALLCALEEFAPCHQAELGARLGINKKDVAERTRDLVEQGFASRSEDPADPRRNVVTITPEGTRRLKQIETALRGAQESLLGDLSERDRGHLLSLLPRLL